MSNVVRIADMYSGVQSLLRRKAASKRWNRKMLERVLMTPWRPRLEAATPAARPKRYITQAYLDKHGRTPDCPGCRGHSTGHNDTCKARFIAIWELEEQAETRGEAARCVRARLGVDGEVSAGGESDSSGSVSDRGRCFSCSWQ